MFQGGLNTVSAVVALSAAMMAPDGAGPWALAVLAALLAWAIVRKDFPAAHVSLFALLWVATAVLFPGARGWPTRLVAPLAIYVAALALHPPLRRSVGWTHAGRLGADVWRWIFATVVVSSAALAAWVMLANPDLSIHLANIPDIPVWSYPLAAVVFATGNAAIEEAAFRGVVMSSLDRTLGETGLSLALQSVCFAAAHYLAGFPNGLFGFAMVIVYGAMLGAIRRRSGGLLAPWIAHVAADLTIFAILAVVILR